MAIRSGAAATGAAATGAGEAETSAGGGGGADSAPSPTSSWTIVGGREVALGGLSLKESSPWGDTAGRRGTLCGKATGYKSTSVLLGGPCASRRVSDTACIAGLGVSHTVFSHRWPIKPCENHLGS